MAYQAYNIAALSEVPNLVGTFAAAQGFTVDATNPNQPIVQHPTYAQAKAFQFSYSEATPTGGTGSNASNCYKRLEIGPVDTSVTNVKCAVETPRMWNGASNLPSMPPPTKLHMFGGLSPQPYLAGVIEYGYNLYRHFYFGYAEKLSGYDGGEIVTGSAVGNADSSNPTANLMYTTPTKVAFPFSSASTYWATVGRNGGMRIVHANNPTTWRTFHRTGTNTSSLLNMLKSQTGAEMVFGGFRDGINTGYLMAAKSPFNGKNILVPINLYLGNLSGTIQAVGRPAGARMVNMSNLDPGQEYQVGSSIWRVFPIFSKSDKYYLNSRNDPQQSAGVSWFANETSYLAGMAYLVSE